MNFMSPSVIKNDRPVLLVWLALTVGAFLFAVPTIRDTGLDYDEAVYGHLAKDFLTGRHCAQHMPGSVSVDLGGRPFPWFVQGYLGAVKCWMLLPSFALFGSSIAVMRFTMFAWGLLGVLFLMLWTRRTLGQTAAVFTGFLMVLDPAFFFPTVCDWGAFVPSFFCRSVGLFAVAIWWKNRRVSWLVFAGVAFGIGFLNKIDFVVFLVALGGATLLNQPRPILQSLRSDVRQWIAGTISFLVTASPMVLNCFRWIRSLVEVQSGAREGELATKFNIATSVLDGSYFYRLMEVGGLFNRMFDLRSPIWTPYGFVLLLSVLVLAAQAVSDARAKTAGWAGFLLAGFGISTVGFWLLPDALRIHHFLLIYPFPQLVIAAAVLRVWKLGAAKAALRRLGKTAAIVIALSVLVGHLVAVRKTQQFIAKTGGRGMWSQALVQFAQELKTRDDLVVASLDWGFHEQLSFLTDGPKLYELTWNLQEGKPVSLVPDTNFIYMIHPPEFSLFDYGRTYLQAALAADPRLSIESRTNLEGRVVLQFFRFSQSPRLP